MYEFKQQDAEEFARFQNIKTFQRGDELIFKTCPYCRSSKRNNEKTFSINLKTGKFHCFRESCGINGNMITLSRDFDFSLGNVVDEYYRPRRQFKKLSQPKEPIKPKPPAVKYLESRGISQETAEKYEITVQTDRENILVFPFYDDKGVMQFVKYRKTDYDSEKDSCKEWCESDCKPILFGMKQCEDFERIVVCEGQLDSLSASQAGVKNAVSVPNGAKGFTWIPYCYDWVSKFKEIVIFGDHEKGHITLLDEMSTRFPKKTLHVREQDYKGCKDANELLQKHGAQAVKYAVENAVRNPVKHVVKIADVPPEDIYKLPKVKTGIRDVDILLKGGLLFGTLTIVAGKRGEGKSTLVSQMNVEAINQGYATLTYSGELPNYLYKSWFDFQIAGRRHIIENNGHFGVERFISNSNRGLINNWYKEFAYIYDSRIVEEDEQDALINTIKETIQRYGVKVIFIDNLMTAMYLDDVKGYDKYDRQGKFVRALSLMALKYEVAIVLVAHRRKDSGLSDVNDDISGSGDIPNQASVIINYERSNELPQDQRKLTVSKNRVFGAINLQGWAMGFDEKSKRIYGDGDDVDREYGWNKDISDGFMKVTDTDEIPY